MITPLRGRDELDVAGLERLIEHILAGGVQRALHPRHHRRRSEPELPPAPRTDRAHLPPGQRPRAGAGRHHRHGLRRIRQPGAACGRCRAPTPWWSRRRITCPRASPNCWNTSNIWCRNCRCRSSSTTCPPSPKSAIELDTVRSAMDEPRIIGLKDSSGDMDYFQKRGRAAPPPGPTGRCSIGPEEKLVDGDLLWAATAASAAGRISFRNFTSGSAQAALAGDTARAQQLQARSPAHQ